jgi:predicted acetyltransferase
VAIPKKAQDRIKAGVRRFQRILEDARAADRSEQDTVTIVTDMLDSIFGYDKYSELTGEYLIRGTYCDLAVKLDGKVKYLIEVKAIDKSLKENHLRQATDYAAKEGIEWVVLTNGVEWQAYRMIFEQPVRFEAVFSIDFLRGGSDIVEMIFMLSREGIIRSALDDYHEQRQVLNRHVVSAVLLSDPVLKLIRRELRRMPPGMNIDPDEIKEIMTAEILKRDIVEGEEIKGAMKKVKKAQKQAESKKSARNDSAGKAATADEDANSDDEAPGDTSATTDPSPK